MGNGSHHTKNPLIESDESQQIISLTKTIDRRRKITSKSADFAMSTAAAYEHAGNRTLRDVPGTRGDVVADHFGTSKVGMNCLKTAVH
jgi:hypothetical protein